jgi:H+/Cl- antiporter ClcA
MYHRRIHHERIPRLHHVPTPLSNILTHRLAIKTITLPLAIASGLSVGKEGPSVHVAVCAGHTISRLFNLSKSAFSMREIYAASSAAGVAVAFGAPIGGVLFSLEEMMSFGGNVGGGTVGRGFLMALVACMCVGGIDPFWTGELVMFEVHYERDWHFFEVPISIPHPQPFPSPLLCAGPVSFGRGCCVQTDGRLSFLWCWVCLVDFTGHS